MSTEPLPENLLKAFPEVYGHVIKKEKKEHQIVKGIELEIKTYKTTDKGGGIRLSLLENSSTPLFQKFQEFLTSIETQRPADEKLMNMWSFTSLSAADPGLEQIEGAGFYVYQNHIVFNEEEKSLSPMERLVLFLEYYKKKFGITTVIRNSEFSELDKLELG